MKLHKIRIHNVFSIGDAELDLSNRGTLLISGYSYDEGSSNGAGKSSLANKSLLWGLFGRTAGGLKADSVINRNIEGGSSWVEVEFDEYKIHRSRNPNKLRLWQNNNDISQRNEKDTQEIINSALGKDFSTFVQCDFFGQGREKSFLSLTPKDQKEILEEILPLEQISLWAHWATRHCSDVGNALHNIDIRLANLKGGIEQAKRCIENAQSSYTSWADRNLADINRLKFKVSERSLNKQEIDDKIKLKKAEINSLGDIPTAEHTGELHNKLGNATTEKRDAQQNLNTTQTKLNYYNDLLEMSRSGVCPFCKQNTNSEYTVEELNESIQKIRDQRDNYLRFSGMWNDLLVQYSDELKSINNKLERYTRLSQELRDLEAEANDEILISLKAELSKLENEKNPYFDTLIETQKDHADLSLMYQEYYEKAEKLKIEFGLLTDWRTIFSRDLRNFIIDQSCPFLTAKTKKHLEGLGNSQIKVQFSTTKVLKSEETRSEFDVSIHSESGGRGFDSLSGGEQQIASFAVGLALSDLARTQVDGSSNVLVLDEPFLFLDARNSENVVNYLNELDRETIILISNEEGLKSLIPNQVMVTKRNGISTIC
jgi:DNA repair exonuclease SbcCD ATPase subunit